MLIVRYPVTFVDAEITDAAASAGSGTHGRFVATNGPLVGAVPFSRDGTSSMKLCMSRDMKYTSRLSEGPSGLAYPSTHSSV